MKRNVELLQQTMQHIKDHPEQHDQNRYWNYCGTPSCFAGWALHLGGIPKMLVLGDTWQAATDILGLTPTERSMLFSPGSTRNMLELMVKDLVNGDELRSWRDYEDEASDV